MQVILVSGEEFVTDVESYTVADGLSQTTINVIFQDSRGFLWIGTQGGLNRYDGYTFKIYNSKGYKDNAISSNFITCITEDKSGNLWIGTKNGLNKYIYTEDRFVYYKHDNKDPLTIASDEIQGLYFDKKNNFWIKTPETVDRMDLATLRFYHYPFFNNIFNFSNERVNYPIVEDNNGKLWVGTKDGLNFLDRGLLLFDRYVQPEKTYGNWSNNIITSIQITKDKNDFLVGTNDGLYAFDRNSKQFTLPYNLKVFSEKTIYALFEDSKGIIWIGSNRGLEVFNRKTNVLQEVKFPENIKINMLQAQITSIFQDRSGLIWVGSNRGLLKINIHAKKFKLINKNSSPKIDLSSDDIASIYKDNNQLWVGTWGEGLNIIDLNTNSLKKYDFSNRADVNLNFIHSIYKDKSRNYWIGTRDGVLHFNLVTGEGKNICEEYKINGCAIIKSNRISHIEEDQAGNLWFASFYGLHKLNKAKNDIQSWLYSPDDTMSMPSNISYFIKSDSKGFFWVGTEKGLVKFDPITGKILKKSQMSKMEKYSGNSIIYTIEVDEENKSIWAGSENGLIRFDLNCNVIRLYTEDDHLSGNIVYSLFKDNYNNLWLSTNRGISKFNIHNETVLNYNLQDGLQNYEFNMGASFKDPNGVFYFGGVSGINVIKPDSVGRSNRLPNIVLTDIEYIDKYGQRNYLPGTSKDITLPYGTNLLTIDFAALDFAYPSKNQYKYKFYSGDDESEWINLGNRHSTTFTNIKPGKYTFKLIGANSDMAWNENGIECKIVVESPFWFTTMAYYLYAFVAVFLFFLIYELRTLQFHKTSKLLKQQEIIAQEMQKQKEELSIKNKNITDSINYAKRIQEALMPSEKQIKKTFHNSFVMLKPKDIVSGDFFWISERKDKVFVAAIDCTGHGVPGAFMSIIGYELFRKITSNQNIESASEMLTLLNKEFESIFRDVNNFTLKDGMDIAFVIIDKVKKTLEFSGAINPMYLIRDNRIMEIRGSRFSIGIEDDVEKDLFFENSIVDLKDDDIFYLFSDGYADQFGGPDGKKFKYRRFRHLLLTIHKFPMDEQLKLLEERFQTWKGDVEQVDDILIIGIKPFANDS